MQLNNGANCALQVVVTPSCLCKNPVVRVFHSKLKRWQME